MITRRQSQFNKWSLNLHVKLTKHSEKKEKCEKIPPKRWKEVNEIHQQNKTKTTQPSLKGERERAKKNDEKKPPTYNFPTPPKLKSHAQNWNQVRKRTELLRKGEQGRGRFYCLQSMRKQTFSILKQLQKHKKKGTTNFSQHQKMKKESQKKRNINEDVCQVRRWNTPIFLRHKDSLFFLIFLKLSQFTMAKFE